ncbi:alpha-glucuronidase family glycosyl hydrolase [Cohnella cholangitidis]|uniref:Xylan alpha-1,2-glucuronidase n=1 Tax=Cohnella cholangitidis TaxID=2598458 RepID=A0A7G5C268_9BACL|nr:alpha-glucuronidase family glycosyl hydrolase [Cohnella cholangitidis]QMV43302.1 alpha-glucuronidase [Cohnella cholangitidis]
MSLGKSESGYDCWLGYRYIDNGKLREAYLKSCSRLKVFGESAILHSARRELEIALNAMLGLSLNDNGIVGDEPAIVAGTFGSSPAFDGVAAKFDPAELGEEGYVVHTADDGTIYLAAAEDIGVLYAAFHLIRLLQIGESIEKLAVREVPGNGLRMINHWDNLDGSIERGYAGNSFFYRDNKFVADFGRIRDYARLLASGAINAAAINNVNVHREESKLITETLLPDVAKVADIFREYGIRLYLSVNFASPIEIGGLDTADPLHPDVARWWEEAARGIYRRIPDFGGFLVKADSEFRPGPFTYGRNHADGANMLANALEPYGGEVIWRCFVYNCLQDWRDRLTDRARAAYDHFMPLDGQFRDNVLLQIKNGPMDFQVREPVSPLLGGLKQTNQVMELQITQEYTGQQRHLCYLVPQWKEALAFDTYAGGEGSTIADIASGRLFGNGRGGIAAVSNIGDDPNWTGHDLAQANFYGFARLAWNPRLSSEQIAKEWIGMTFPHDPETAKVVAGMLLDSYSIYESYTAPLGVGWMVNPDHHYGPNVDGYEYSKWGTYHFADNEGIGVDRTARSGTGYTRQYHSPQSDMYEALETCPDELLLFFHHVPYTHALKSGKSVIQHIYDSHFEGADRAARQLEQWDSVKAKVDPGIYNRVRKRLVDQAEHALEWRDQINTYFYRKSGIADMHDRVIY